MPTHRIRLPPPWQTKPVCTEQLVDGQLITTQQFERNFQRPGGLTADSRIELEVLVAEGMDRPHQLSCILNDRRLDPVELAAGSAVDEPRKFRIENQWLLPTNRVSVQQRWLGQPASAEVPQVALLLS